MTIGTDVIALVLRLTRIQEYVRRLAQDPELAMQTYKLIRIGELSPNGDPFVRVKDRVNHRISHVMAE